MDGHLVAVKVGVKSSADQGRDLDGLPFHQHGLEGLNAEAVQRRGAVEEDRVVFDDLLENIPDHGLLALDHLFGALDGGGMALLFQPVIDERLEQLESHLLGEAALVQLQLGSHHDYRTARVVDALAEEVLAETSRFSLERVAERLQRTVVGASQDAAPAAVVEHGVHGFLQHPFLVTDDHLGGAQFHQLLEPVVAVDHAPVEVIQIGSRESAAVQRDQRPQLGRNHRDHIQDHPLRLIPGLAERIHNFKPLGILHALELRGFRLHGHTQLIGHLLHVHALEQLFDGLCAHHRPELAWKLLHQGPEFLLVQKLLELHGRLARIDDHIGLEVQHALQVAQAYVEQVTDAAGKPFEKPHVRAGGGQLDVPQPFPADFGEGDFHPALVAGHAPVLHALVFSAQAFPVGHGTENTRAEQPVLFGLERPIVDGLRFGYLPVRPCPDLLRRSETDSNTVEISAQIRFFHDVLETSQWNPPF